MSGYKPESYKEEFFIIGNYLRNKGFKKLLFKENNTNEFELGICNYSIVINFPNREHQHYRPP